MATMQKITLNPWFVKKAEEVAKYYTSIFKTSKIGRTSHHGKEGQDVHVMKEGPVTTIEF